MIEGLKLTLYGEEIRDRLDARIREHERRVSWWKQQAVREQDAEDPGKPSVDACEDEVERHEWRIAVLTFIREHIQPLEYYALQERDLDFAELLPERPQWLEYEGLPSDWEEDLVRSSG